VARLTETARYGVVDADAGRSTVELRLKAVVVASTSGVDELQTGGTGRVVVPAETLRRRRAARAAAAAIDRQPATIYTARTSHYFMTYIYAPYLYHCVWSVITAHNLTPEKRANNYLPHPLITTSRL